MSWSIEYRGAEGAAAFEACRTAAQYQVMVAQLLRLDGSSGQVFHEEHGQVMVRGWHGARTATCWFVE